MLVQRQLAGQANASSMTVGGKVLCCAPSARAASVPITGGRSSYSMQICSVASIAWRTVSAITTTALDARGEELARIIALETGN